MSTLYDSIESRRSRGMTKWDVTPDGHTVWQTSIHLISLNGTVGGSERCRLIYHLLIRYHEDGLHSAGIRRWVSRAGRRPHFDTILDDRILTSQSHDELIGAICLCMNQRYHLSVSPHDIRAGYIRKSLADHAVGVTTSSPPLTTSASSSPSRARCPSAQ
jgi:hypothetical protein